MDTDPSTATVVIPILNDADALGRLLKILREEYPHLDVRVVDGGSRDRSRAIANAFETGWMESEAGRGRQMNCGAAECSREILWFLHADSSPYPRSVEAILESLKDPEVVGGAFRFRLSESRWYGPLFHFTVGLRSKILKLPYGDQGFFVRRKIFESLGGFSTGPLMEDVDFIRRLRKVGKIVILETPIGVSPRRWDREGVFRRTLLNWTILLGYFIGFSPEALARFYRFPRR